MAFLTRHNTEKQVVNNFTLKHKEQVTNICNFNDSECCLQNTQDGSTLLPTVELGFSFIPILSNMDYSSASKASSTSTLMGERASKPINIMNNSISLPLAMAAFLMLAFVRRRYRKESSSGPTYKQPFPASTNLPATIPLPPHPIFNHMPNVFAAPDSDKFNSVVKQYANEFGISTFWFLRTPSVCILHADHVRSVLRNSVERRGFDIFSRHFKRSLGRESIVIMNGDVNDIEKWRKHRNLVKVAFTSNAVKKMSWKVWSVANRFAESILKECDGESVESQEMFRDRRNETTSSTGIYAAEALDIFKWATIDVFGSVSLNYDFGCTEKLEQTPLATSFDFTIEDSNARVLAKNLLNPFTQFYWLPTKRNAEFKSHFKTVRDLLGDICEKRSQDIEREIQEMGGFSVKSSGSRRRSSVTITADDDLLTILLKSKARDREENPEANSNSNNDHKEMIEMLMTLFFAGYDTSSIGLTYAMYCLCNNTRIQDECAKEAREASDDMDFDPSLWETQLAYCWAVVMETMRMHPPVFNNARNMTKDLTLENGDSKCIIPGGARVYLPIIQIHTYEKNFARPLEFIPERWVRKDAASGKWVARDYTAEMKDTGNVDTSNPEYVPPANPNNLFTFSDGARSCIGRRLAIQESTMLLASIVKDLEVETRPGFIMQKRKKFAMAPPTEMPLLFRRRR